jgi:hypothetical protein
MNRISIIEGFKKVMHDGMLKNFETDGQLQPIMFLLFDEQGMYKPVISPLQGDLMQDKAYKKTVTAILTDICKNPSVIAAGIICEAYGAKISCDDKITDKLLNGEISVSELDEKDDIIIMLFSTPINEEVIVYVVDVKNKSIGEKYPETDGFESIFSGLFGWRKK